MYFAIYQAIAEDERRPGLYREYPPDFFDLVIVDECHRGSARDESNWREILEYFEPAFQLGMTATPLREDNRDTYLYFGNPIYAYSLRQGIEDGFLAPYRVHRVITEWDAAGWRPSKGDLDRYGREIPDEEYQTKDFERVVALRARTEAIARHLTDFLKKTDRFAKTIVFCVDQEHADEMRRALGQPQRRPRRSEHPDYVCRVTADEGDIGRGHLSRFQDVETQTPVILTTSQLLTTGVDAPTCKNIVLARVVGSMTRVQADHRARHARARRLRQALVQHPRLHRLGHAAVRRPRLRRRSGPDDRGGDRQARQSRRTSDDEPETSGDHRGCASPGSSSRRPRSGGSSTSTAAGSRSPPTWSTNSTRTASSSASSGTPTTRRRRCARLCPIRAGAARAMGRPRGARRDHRDSWTSGASTSTNLAEAAEQPDADPFDLLCHLAFNAPLRTRRERAQRLRTERKDFFDHYGPEARQILEELLEKYAEHGDAQFVLPDVLKVPPISAHGQPSRNRRALRRRRSSSVTP